MVEKYGLTLFGGNLIVPILLCLIIGYISGSTAEDNEHAYRSYQGSIYCNAGSPTKYPTSVEEVAALVKETAKVKGTLKVLGSSHSMTDIICTEGTPISLSKMKGDPVYEKEKGRASFPAGMTLKTALEFLEKLNRTLINVPLYNGITIGGATATGAHASSLRHPTSISDQVVGLEVVDGSGHIKVINDTKTLSAFRVHLGLLGILTRVTLQTVPLFKLVVENRIESEEVLFHPINLIERIKGSDHFQLWWFPNSKEVVVASGNHTSAEKPGSASCHVVADVKEDLAKGTAFVYEWFHWARSRWGLDFLEKSAKTWMVSKVDGVAPFYGEGDNFTNPAVGVAWKLLSSHCTKGQCWWDNDYAVVNGLEVSVAFPISEWKGVLAKIRDTLTQLPASFHQFGIMFRFSGKGDGLMSLFRGSSGEDRFTAEWIVPLRKDPYTSALDGLGCYQGLMQEFVLNHGGIPHWGKNGLYYFTQSILTKTLSEKDRSSFIAKMKEYDPHGVFLNKFGRRILGQGDEMDVDPLMERCALHDYCVCKKDSDCGEWQTCENWKGFYICQDIIPFSVGEVVVAVLVTIVFTFIGICRR